MMIGVLFGNFCSSCFIKISVSFYVKITFFPDFFDDLTPVAPDFLGSLGWELFIPQILFMGFFLIVPVRILHHPCFFVMLTLVITDIPELGCCITHMPDEVRIFPADLYGCFL